MTQQEITQAFENRWRIKAEAHPEAWVKGVKELCRDFFTAAILLTEKVSLPPCAPAAFSPQGEANGSSEAHTCAPTDDFDIWWNLYGKKIDRAKCEKKWLRLSEKERQACILATPAYVASTPDLQFRRHPATYLNNKSWNNQIITSNAIPKPTVSQRASKLASILTE